MAGKFTGKINLLCKAIDYKYHKIFFVDTQQFYSDAQHRRITMFILSERIYDEERDVYHKQQILKTAAQLDVLQYLANEYKRLSEGEGNNENFISI